MRTLVDKLQEVERRLCEERGAFALFALFEREDATGVWDLVVSAPWIEEDRRDALDHMFARLRRALSQDELRLIAKIAVVPPEDPLLQAMQKAVQVEHGAVEIKDGVFFDMRINHAHVITSNRAAA